MKRLAKRLVSDRSGSAAVELALVLPIMLTLFFGGFEVTRLLSANTRVASAAQTIADLVAQQTAVSSTTITNFCNGGKLVMTPFSGTSLSAAIVSVTNKAGALSIDWQDTTCGTASSMANATTLATALDPSSGDSVIIVRANYSYTSPIAYVLHAAYGLSQVAYARPQVSASVAHN